MDSIRDAKAIHFGPTEAAAKITGPGRHSLAFTFNGTDVMFDDARLVNLTAMWKAAGSEENKSPYRWKRFEGAKFIKHMTSVLNGSKSPIMKAERGKGGATWAHWQIALAYAKYLSHEFHQFVSEAFKEWTEEKVNPELKADRAFNAMVRKFGEEKASARFNGIPSLQFEFPTSLKIYPIRYRRLITYIV